MSNEEEALELHAENPGKISVEPSVEVETAEDLELVYTPGVAEPCRRIAEKPEKSYDYTTRGNLVGIVSDGSAVLGLGDIGPEASMPVMEGKANLMKKFAGVDGVPLCIDASSPQDSIEFVERVAPTFGAFNLEDISAPQCFEIERNLKQKLDIPVFHDDQHGTAIVVLAALQNALEVVGKDLEDSGITIVGAGASGTAVAEFLHEAGAGEILAVDRNGVINTDIEEDHKQRLAELTGPHDEETMEEAFEDSDVFIGLSTGGIVSKKMVESMSDDPVVFALANPDPEIHPEKAKEAGAEVVATGRSDFDNQVNNSLAFPGVFRGALDAQASEINEEMKLAASHAIKHTIDTPRKDRIVPETLDRSLAAKVAEAVEQAARGTGVSRDG